MPLMSNGLYLDQRYKEDCESKIDYLNLNNNNNKSLLHSENYIQDGNKYYHCTKITDTKYKKIIPSNENN